MIYLIEDGKLCDLSDWCQICSKIKSISCQQKSQNTSVGISGYKSLARNDVVQICCGFLGVEQPKYVEVIDLGA